MSVRVRSDPGRWEDRGHAGDYLLKSSVHCICCGRMLIRRAWVSEERVFCEPECERLYRDYWLPSHGAPEQ